MLNFTWLLKLFKKDDCILAALRPDMNEAELAVAIPRLSERLVRFIHDHAIRFYRSIGSHDFGAYPGVWEEFFFLILFVTERRLKSILSTGNADKTIMSLKDNLNGFLLKHDSKFEQQPFWERYEQRIGLYKIRLQPGYGFEKIISAFSSNVMTRLADWPALVSHHSSNAAAAALAELCGEDSGDGTESSIDVK
jgi:hypothetical protein